MAKNMKKTVEEAVEKMEKNVEKVQADMAAVVEQVTGSDHENSSILAATRRVLMAGVGVVALTKDEIEDFVTKLIERGEIAEQDGVRLVRDVLHRRREDVGEMADKMQEETEKQFSRAESMLDQRIESILGRLNVPSKLDIDMLSDKISLLADKVDALKNS